MININGEDIADLIHRRFAGTQPPQDFSVKRLGGDLPPGFLPEPPWKPASVLVPVVAHPQPTLLLTRRTEQLQDHAGQVSFPGGGRESADTDAVQTALRETEEEIGLGREYMKVAGFLDGYLTVSGYAVTPVVALVAPGFTLRLDPLEVAEVFEVPLAFLADPSNRQVRQRRFGDRDVSYYVFEYGPHLIWGATAGMLVNFLDKLTEPQT
jgi:8-oxo-dGTP pyrophosphatase MutT (NUDIX family)